MTGRGRARGAATLLAAFFLLLLLSCGKAPQQPPEVEILIKGNEYDFDPAGFRVPPKTIIRLVLENVGEQEHSLRFESDVSRLRIFALPGKRASALFTTPREGGYPFWCDIGSHRFFGMEGVMTVRSPSDR